MHNISINQEVKFYKKNLSFVLFSKYNLRKKIIYTSSIQIRFCLIKKNLQDIRNSIILKYDNLFLDVTSMTDIDQPRKTNITGYFITENVDGVFIYVSLNSMIFWQYLFSICCPLTYKTFLLKCTQKHLIMNVYFRFTIL